MGTRQEQADIVIVPFRFDAVVSKEQHVVFEYEELVNQLQNELDEAKFYYYDVLTRNETLENELSCYKEEIEKKADEFAAVREKLEAEIMELETERMELKAVIDGLETENTELRDEISALKDTIDTMWKIYNPGGEYPDWSKYTLDQLIAMKDELLIIIEIRIKEAYAEGML